MYSKNSMNNGDVISLRNCGNVRKNGSTEVHYEFLLPRSAPELLTDTKAGGGDTDLQDDQKFATFSSIIGSGNVRIRRSSFRQRNRRSHSHDLNIAMWTDGDDSFKDSGFICTTAAHLRSDDGSTDSGKEIRPNRLSVENGDCAAAADIHTRLLMDSEEAKKHEKYTELMPKVSREVISNRMDDARFRSGDASVAEIEKSWKESPQAKKFLMEDDSFEDNEFICPPAPPPSPNELDDDNTDSGKEIGLYPLSVEYGQCAAPEDLRRRLLMEIEKAKRKPRYDQWIPKVSRTVASSAAESHRLRCGHDTVAEFDKSWEESPQAKKCHTEVVSTTRSRRPSGSEKDLPPCDQLHARTVTDPASLLYIAARHLRTHHNHDEAMNP